MCEKLLAMKNGDENEQMNLMVRCLIVKLFRLQSGDWV